MNDDIRSPPSAAPSTVSPTTLMSLPPLGQGTWRMGEVAARRNEEIAALRLGADLGMTLIDTAEMYGDGEAESLVGEAFRSRRDEVFIVSKVYPQNADWDRLPKACERSLKRLKTDRIDLYLLHWRGGVPLAETVEVMQALKRAGKIVNWGVSNFDTEDMAELVEADGAACVADQILYNLSRRSAEFDLLPWLEAHNMIAMAYSPVEQGRLLASPALKTVADQLGAAPAEVALAWAIRHRNVVAIPKAATAQHVRTNRAALDLKLDAEALAALDRAFPAPARKGRLQML
jgi:diketogulonate reductase-like aldo/keto reductase